MTIRNSPAVCRWFARHATGWQLDADPAAS
jgi:hypothetical protein